MDFKTFKEKLLLRKKYMAMLDNAISSKDQFELMDKIKIIEREISGRPNISHLQFDGRLATFFQISKDDFAKIILPICSKCKQKVSYYKEEKFGIIKGLKFEGFEHYLYLLNDDNFSLKSLYKNSVNKTCWDELFEKFPGLENQLWEYMESKSKLLSDEYVDILNEKLESNQNLIVKLSKEKSKLRQKEIARTEKINEQLVAEIESCKKGNIMIFN